MSGSILRFLAPVALIALGLAPLPVQATEPAADPAPVADPVTGCEADRNGRACLDQAIRLYHGKDIAQDYTASRRFAAKACALEEMLGCNYLGALLEDGLGGPVDVPGAVRNYRRACDGGYSGACHNLGQTLYENAAKGAPELADARASFVKGCEASIPDSCNNYAVMMKLGEGGPQDLVGAVSMFEAVCEAGKNVDACANQGYMLMVGEGVAKDPARAAKLLSTACEQGSTFACDHYGLILLNGLAGDRDPSRAKALFAAACKGGEANACYNLGEVLIEDLAGGSDLPAARAAYSTSCDGGIVSACSKLAQMTFDGQGGPKDRTAARQMYADLCSGGDAKSCMTFNVLAELGEGGPRDREASNRALEKGCSLGHEIACSALKIRQSEK
ncbi:sel1 repeat family protein [Tsuneonella flava]|uniref:Sel1 repeat family protein n=1 Tax=Tsuneonella flava TaxID=2055955 RepID=A0ABX7K8Y2_9SPHN|nr:tetratricopeptide repeat protein [Tsuneonella flava]QSB44721.1 sel1 repeat family protein [Tsuneonella flava]